MVRASEAFSFSMLVAVSLSGCGSQNDATLPNNPDASEQDASTSSVLSLDVSTTLSVRAEAPSCQHYALGNPTWDGDVFKAPASYKDYLKDLDVSKLYETIKNLMRKSEVCWPADGPQDGDEESYAGLFGRLAWHCAGTLRIKDDTSTGGCEGGRIRFWPEAEWRDNGNLDKARALLGGVKNMPEYQHLSWGDLITFAGTVGIKASGGPANKFCFGRIDSTNGKKSVMLGTEGIENCPEGQICERHTCETSFRWPDQDVNDPPRCNFTQPDGRLQASHSVGLIYVYPEGPQLRKESAEYDARLTHQRSPELSAKEIRQTFHSRMGWTDQETVALIGGGHTLGRAHGNCPDKKSCLGEHTSTSGFEGAWTRTPSRWNYDFFDGLIDEEWTPTKSPEGADQWRTLVELGAFRDTMRLTSDLALIKDESYKQWSMKYKANHTLFDHDFANAWFKLMHRSEDHPTDDDLEKTANKCTNFDFVQ